MRAGPLSDSKVIDLLNRHFVPVYTVNEDYSRNGAAPAEEKAERERIFKAGHAANKSVGTVHVYILAPDGALIDSLHVAEAARTSKLIQLLEGTVRELKTAAGEPVCKPSAQSEPPACDKDCVRLHLTARSLDGRGAWSEFPVENWIVLSPADQRELTANGSSTRIGEKWQVPAAIATKLLTHFYPATENNDVSKNRFLEQKLAATVVSRDGDRIRARLDGSFRMEHWFYHKPDGKVVDASVVGFMDFNPSDSRISNFRLLADKASYGGGAFAIAVRSVR